MSTSHPLWLLTPTGNSGESELAEIMTAIELVTRGAARRVSISGVVTSDSVAARGLAAAQAAGIEFALVREPGTPRVLVVVGPRHRK